MDEKMTCRFMGICKAYNPTNKCCQTNGDYYGPGRKAGCYREFEKLEIEKFKRKTSY
jgi:hypothetical protein